jgi:hypothetical protein
MAKALQAIKKLSFSKKKRGKRKQRERKGRNV